MHYSCIHHLYYFKTFLFPNCFLGILVQREIIANASMLVRISPRTDCKSTKIISKSSSIYKKRYAKKQKKRLERLETHIFLVTL